MAISVRLLVYTKCILIPNNKNFRRLAWFKKFQVSFAYEEKSSRPAKIVSESRVLSKTGKRHIGGHNQEVAQVPADIAQVKFGEFRTRPAARHSMQKGGGSKDVS